MSTTTKLTAAQLKALALVAAAQNGAIRGTIATSTRRWLVAQGLVERGVNALTDAGRAEMEGRS